MSVFNGIRFSAILSVVILHVVFGKGSQNVVIIIRRMLMLICLANLI